MAKAKGKTEDLSVDKRISRTEKKIKSFFKSLSKERLAFITEAIHQLAVTQVLLERLSEELEKGDVIELFEQGKQRLRRENPALKSYNTTVKSYVAIFKQLSDILPSEEADTAGSELMAFITRGKK